MEDSKSVLAKMLDFFRANLLVVTLFLVGLMMLGYGLIALIGSSDSRSDIVFESSNQASGSAEMGKSNITVDVEGGVVKPGVYQLSSPARVQDALIAAGGLSASADRVWVAKNLNLAVKVTDGGKIYIPIIGESSANINQSSVQGQMDTSVMININTASEAQLDSLPGIGPVTAQKIISGRSYGSIDELLSKKIVTSSVFSKIKDKIAVY